MFSEQDVERELKAALSLRPSPDFEARVLRRVEADRPPAWSARSGWLAAAAAVIIVAAVFYALDRAPVAVPARPAPRIVEQVAPPVVPLAPPTVPTRTHTSEPPRVRSLRASVGYTPASRPAEPEVIVPVNQMEAVRRLVFEANAGRGIEGPAEPVPGPMAPPAALGVAPVVIEPIRISPVVPEAEPATPFIRGVK